MYHPPATPLLVLPELLLVLLQLLYLLMLPAPTPAPTPPAPAPLLSLTKAPSALPLRLAAFLSCPNCRYRATRLGLRESVVHSLSSPLLGMF